MSEARLKAILIDPYEKRVTDITVHSYEFADLYGVLECGVIEEVDLKSGHHILLCDESGLFKAEHLLKYFVIGMWPHPISGKSVIVKRSLETMYNDDADCGSYGEPTLTADEIRPFVTFTGSHYGLLEPDA